MHTRNLLLLTVSWLALGAAALAFPPAPFHTYYGVVRDELGNPLDTSDATVILSSSAGEIARCTVDRNLGPGRNYTLRVPMDAGTASQLYRPTAMQPTLPFTIRVVKGGVTLLPIEIAGKALAMGDPSERTRLDLTLGEDTDGDGLPDAWERNLIEGKKNDHLRTLADVKPGDDADRDGLTNLQEYLAGTYALDRLDGVTLEVVDVANGIARLRFLATSGRSYRIRSSPDAKTWSEQSFSLDPSGANPVANHLSDDVQWLDVFVTIGEARRGFFQLFAE